MGSSEKWDKQLVSFAAFPWLARVAGETGEPPLIAAFGSLLLGAALLLVSRGLGDLIGSFYRGPGLPQSRQPEAGRAQLADLIASFWTWGVRFLGVMFTGFAVYIVVARLA